MAATDSAMTFIKADDTCIPSTTPRTFKLFPVSVRGGVGVWCLYDVASQIGLNMELMPRSDPIVDAAALRSKIARWNTHIYQFVVHQLDTQLLAVVSLLLEHGVYSDMDTTDRRMQIERSTDTKPRHNDDAEIDVDNKRA